MSTRVLLLLFFLISDISSQIIRFHHGSAIDQLRQQQQQQHYTSVDINNYIEYDLTPEKILEHMSLSFYSNETSTCEQEFKMLVQAALKREMWAIKTFDAWGKPLPSGVLSGNVHWVGNYDECLQEMYLPNNKSFVSQPFTTQYCTLLPKPSRPNAKASLSITLGLCIPSSCDRKSVATLVDMLFKKNTTTENDLVCSNDPPNGQKNLTPGAIATCIVLSLLGLIVLLGTITDVILTSQHQKSVDNITTNTNGYNYLSDHEVPTIPTSRIAFLAEFSAIKTLRRIFTIKKQNDDDSFLFINGIRVLALFWIIIGHSIAFSFSYTSNMVDLLVWTRNVFFQLIINATLSVDTFFVLSGFLTAILFIRQVKKEGKLSFRLFILYYIHRYIRLTPTFLLIILVSINLTPYFGQGPVYPKEKGFESDECRSGLWWTSVLYVGNLVNPYKMCLGITWYLHNDMQFHWIAPIALIPFVLGRKSISFIVATLFILIGIGSILSILLFYPTMSVDVLEAFTDKPGPTFYKNIYATPWCRISAYAVGLITGFLVSSFSREYRLNRNIKIFGTIIAILFSLACLFTTYPDYILVPGLSRSILVAYQSLVRTFWSIAISWLLFSCSIHQGGLVNKILSWSIWAPLARLNYSCYLVHSTVLHTMMYSQKIPFYYQPHLVVNNFVSQIFFSYVTAIVVTIFFETPFFVVEKKLFKR